MRIYLASSWRNEYQAVVLADLRNAGHQVYDFKAAPDSGFRWRDVDPGLWENPTPEQLARALATRHARLGFQSDLRAMEWAEACVLFLPSGMSAHMEAAHMAGAGKLVVILAPQGSIREPELMYRLFCQRSWPDMPRAFADQDADFHGDHVPIATSTEQCLEYLSSLERWRQPSPPPGVA